MLCEGCGIKTAKRQTNGFLRGFCGHCYKFQWKLMNKPAPKEGAKCKTCSVHITAFHKSGMCQPCYKKDFFENPKHKKIANDRMHEWRLKNPARYKMTMDALSRTDERRFQSLISTAKQRNKFCDLSWDQYSKIIESGKCHYCHGPLPEVRYGIDRKDSSVGYIVDNCVPCCTSCNQAKSFRLSESEMLAVMETVRIADMRVKL